MAKEKHELEEEVSFHQHLSCWDLMENVLYLWLLIWFSCFSDKYVCDLRIEKRLKTQITRAH